MVGQGVLRECQLSPDVQLVQTIERTVTGASIRSFGRWPIRICGTI